MRIRIYGARRRLDGDPFCPTVLITATDANELHDIGALRAGAALDFVLPMSTARDQDKVRRLLDAFESGESLLVIREDGRRERLRVYVVALVRPNSLAVDSVRFELS